MFFVEPLSNGTEDGIFGYPNWDAITFVSPSGRFLNDHMYSCVVNRYGPLHQVLKNMCVAMEVARFSHRKKALSFLDSVGISPLVESLSS